MKEIIKNRLWEFQGLYSQKTIESLRDDWNASIWRLTKGRYDFWLNSNGLFNSDSFLNPPKVIEIIEKQLGEYISYSGALPSEPNSNNGEWHTDATNLFDKKTDEKLPPYYFTLLIPLEDISLEMGPTEIQISKNKTYKAILQAGDAILVDGRVWHRGTANKSDKERRMLYIVFCKKWYDGEYIEPKST